MPIGCPILTIHHIIHQIPKEGGNRHFIGFQRPRRDRRIPGFQIKAANAAVRLNIDIDIGLWHTGTLAHGALEVIGIALAPGKLNIIQNVKRAMIAAQ